MYAKAVRYNLLGDALISGFLMALDPSGWLIVWADGFNKCGWCLAGGRGC